MPKSKGSKTLKTKLWNRYSFEKQSRLSKLGIDEKSNVLTVHKYLPSKKLDTQKTVSDHTLSKCFIPLNESVLFNLHTCVIDSGLFNSRRFMTSWKMNPLGVTKLELNPKKNQMNLIHVESPSTISFLNANTDPGSKLDTIRENCEKYLKIQLELSEFVTAKRDQHFTSNLNVQQLKPRFGNQIIRSCFECTDQIRNNIGYI